MCQSIIPAVLFLESPHGMTRAVHQLGSMVVVGLRAGKP